MLSYRSFHWSFILSGDHPRYHSLVLTSLESTSLEYFPRQLLLVSCHLSVIIVEVENG